MKKFQFSLDTVLQYKQQRLDALKAEIMRNAETTRAYFASL